MRADVRSATYGMNQGYFSWCPDPTATVSAVLTNDRDEALPTPEMLSVGLCVCPGLTEGECRKDLADQMVLYCPSDPDLDKVDGRDYSMKDFAWNDDLQQMKYFYHPIAAASTQDLGALSGNQMLDNNITVNEFPDQKLYARWRDVVFAGARTFMTFRTDQFRLFPGFQLWEMLSTFPDEDTPSGIQTTHNLYSKLKFSSPRVRLSPFPTDPDWNPESTNEYGLLYLPPGSFSYDPEVYGLCIRFPRPVGQPIGFAEGSPLPVDPLWDPPRDLTDPLFGWILDEDGVWRLFGVDPASFQVRSYVALPSSIDLRRTDMKMLRLDAALIGGAAGYWATVAAVLDRGSVFLRDPVQPGAWTQVPTELPSDQTLLAFHQASPDSVWVIGRQSMFSAPILSEVNLATGSILRQETIEDWKFVRVESMGAPRMGEAYFLIKRPAHLLPSLWKLDKDGLRSDLALPALVPPDRGALAVDARMEIGRAHV